MLYSEILPFWIVLVRFAPKIFVDTKLFGKKMHIERAQEFDALSHPITSIMVNHSIHSVYILSLSKTMTTVPISYWKRSNKKIVIHTVFLRLSAFNFMPNYRPCFHTNEQPIQSLFRTALFFFDPAPTSFLIILPSHRVRACSLQIYIHASWYQNFPHVVWWTTAVLFETSGYYRILMQKTDF